MKRFIIATVLLICVIFTATQQTNSVTVFATLEGDYEFTGCYCLSVLYTCTYSATWNGIATFSDPIPQGQNIEITQVIIAVTGDLYCNSGANHLSITPSLNNVVLSTLVGSSTSELCYCDCNTVSNTTYFQQGFTNYVRGGVNTITTVVGPSTISCYTGYNVTLTYQPANTGNSPSPTPHPSGGSEGLTCCVYAGGPGAYDVTCTTGVCAKQSYYDLVAHFPVSSCADCLYQQ